MRLVLDTNTAISALLWHGTPGKPIDAAQSKTLSLFSSAPLLAELRGVLSREKFAKQLKAKSLTPDEIADGYAALVSIVTPAVVAISNLPNLGSDHAKFMHFQDFASGGWCFSPLARYFWYRKQRSKPSRFT